MREKQSCCHGKITVCSTPYNLKTPVCKTSTFQASYFNRIVKLWNYICKLSPPTSFSTMSTLKQIEPSLVYILLSIEMQFFTTVGMHKYLNVVITATAPGATPAVPKGVRGGGGEERIESITDFKNF